MSKGTTEFWCEFIQIYKENPCLWDRQSPDFNNKSKRNLAYGMLVEKYWELNENADLKTVSRKLIWFHSRFANELKKENKKRGEKVESTWEYFRPLSFLALQEQGLDLEEDKEDTIEIDSDDNDSKPKPAESSTVPISNETDMIDNQDPSIQPPEKKIKLSDTETLAIDTRLDLKDDSSMFAEFLITKMRSFDPQQKCIAQKLIFDVMFLAETKQLQLSSKVVKDGSQSS